MAKEINKNQDQNQEPEQIQEEEVTLGMVKESTGKKIVKIVIAVATTLGSAFLGWLIGKNGKDDDNNDSGDVEESNEE